MKSGSSGTPSLLTRQSLLFRLRNRDDQFTWQEFFRLYRKLVYGLALRLGLAHAEAEDVVQEVFLHVSQHIGDFEARSMPGGFRRWLMNQTRWRIMDKYRQRARTPVQAMVEESEWHLAPGAAVLNESENSHEAIWEKEWQHHVMETALDRLARRIPAKQFQAFELYSKRGWSVGQIADELGMNPAAIYLYNHRITKQLRAEAERIRRTLA